MTARIQKLLDQLKDRAYRRDRVRLGIRIDEQTKEMGPEMRDATRLKVMLEHEKPIIFEGDRMGFYRFAIDHPKYTSPEWGWESCWSFGNITPNYGRVMEAGFDAILADVRDRRRTCSEDQVDYYDSLECVLEACIALADRYREAAREKSPQLFEALSVVPRKRPTNFLEACVFLKLITYTLRCNSNIHVTLGRFDQYMLPYYTADIERGVGRELLLETLEEFFISINFDSDLYQGMQQGDNGQSLVLGGYDGEGNDQFNDLSLLCMEASMELNLIDPKINLRVSKKTPFDRFLLGTRMTGKGLGFPQYCNDDVVVDGLIQLGYDREDALNYTVAACWEFIVPGCGCDVPNFITMNFPRVVREVMIEKLEQCETYEALFDEVAFGVRRECDALMKWACEHSPQSVSGRPTPYLSIYVDGCMEAGRDILHSPAKYHNYGCHGAGLSNAVDALAAVKKTVFEEKSIEKSELLAALECNFEGCEQLRKKLVDAPKMGNNDNYVDMISIALMNVFSEYLNGKPNDRGGIFRAGTGSALEYITSSKTVGATADGRRAFEPYASSFSPAITTRLNGPLSVIQSFTKYDMRKIINGGPLTMEIHDSTFRNEEGYEKVAMLVRAFINRGGHQLQLNAINRDILLEAREHPEKHPQLIVRVWGWSGYFNELDQEYQDHVIRRTEFQA